MDASSSATKPSRTILWLFCLSLAGIPTFPFLAFLSFGVWWFGSFDWDADAMPPLKAYVGLGLSLFCLVATVAAFAGFIVSGVMLLRRRSAA